MIEKKRRSGRPAYTHSYEVAAILEKKGYPIKYVITGLFHDVLEDTIFDEEFLRLVLKNYIEKYKSKECLEDPNFIEDIITATKVLSKHKGLKKKDLKYLDDLVEKEKEPQKYRTELEEGYKRFKVARAIGFKSFRQIAKEEFTEQEMPEYMENIEKNEIAKIVKIADRIANLQDFAPTDSVKRRRDFIEETKESFFTLAKGTDLEEDLMMALDVSKKTYSVEKANWKKTLMVATKSYMPPSIIKEDKSSQYMIKE